MHARRVRPSPLGRLALPDSWRGTPAFLGTGYGGVGAPVRLAGVVVQPPVTMDGSASEVDGSGGTEGSGAAAKLNADVRSPVTDRRHALRLGTSAPKRVSTKRRSDVWSKRSEHTSPPRLNGEITSSGTRKPRPIGPAIPCAAAGSGCTVRYSPRVPGGGVGGGMWSKKPPFSSQAMSSAVLAHRSALPVSALRIRSVVYSPWTGGAGGCSLWVIGPQIHDTCGSAPFAQSASNMDGKSLPNAPAASAGSVWYCLNSGNGMSPVGS